MSESVSQLKVIKVSDNRINDNDEKTYCIVQGGQLYTRRYFNYTSLSTSSISFNNVNPPNMTTYVSKYIPVTMTWVITFTGTTTGTHLLDGWGTTMALRAMPFNNSQISGTLQMNNATFSEDINDVLPYILRCRFQQLVDSLSETPVYLDASQNYSELTGSVRNPLGSYGNSVQGGPIPRGGFNFVQFLTNTPTSASIRVTVTEPILISPLDFYNNNDPYFNGLQTFQYNGVFDPNIASRILSISNNSPATFSAINVNPEGALINFTYITPSVATQVPRTMVFSYHNFNRYVTDNNIPLPAGASTSQVNNNIQISSIPKRIVVFVKQKRSTLTPSSTDTFARITKVSIEFMNKSSLLNSASTNQLYDMSKFNGVDASWPEWYGSSGSGIPLAVSGVGSVLVFEPASDLGLDNLGASGMTMNTQLQITVDYTNINPTNALTFSLYILTIDDGIVTMNSGACYVQNSIVGTSDLLQLNEMPPEYTTADAIVQDRMGGDLFGNIKSFFHKNLPLFKQIFDVGKQVAPIVAPLLGLGEGDGLVGGRRRYRGRGLVGGASLDRMRLQNLM